MIPLEVGEFLVYPCQGVGRITSIEQRDVAGTSTRFLQVRVLDTQADVLIPAERVADSGVRPLVDASRADNVLSVFDQPVGDSQGVSWIRRNRLYQSYLSHGDAEEVAVVLRDLLYMKMTGRLTFGQLQTFERSYRTTVHELAIALDTSPKTIEGIVIDRLRRANGLLPSAA